MAFLPNSSANVAYLDSAPHSNPLGKDNNINTPGSFQASLNLEDPFQKVALKKKDKASAQKFTYITKSKVGSPN